MWLALRFPHWALDSRLDDGAAATALVAEADGGRRYVIAAGHEALRAGVRRGMALADARLRLPEAHIHARTPAAEHAALERLAGWAWRYSDQIHIESTDDGRPCARLVMEIGASLRLFGGRRRLLAAVFDELATRARRYRAGWAATPAAALVFARAPKNTRGQELAALPLTCLALEHRVRASLAASGLGRVGEVLALPPASLARRYGTDILDYLERLRGRRPHGLTLYRPPERYRARHELLGRIETVDGLVFVLRAALAELAAVLRGAGATIQTLRLELIHETAPATGLTLRLAAPTRDAAHLERVLRDRLARTALTAPVYEIELASDRLRDVQPAQNRLWHEAPPGHAATGWPATLDRLRARLGRDAVTWLDAPADHRPERASAYRDAPPADGTECGPPRPLWLLDTPRPVDTPFEIVAGPERIESGWWEHGIRRDYFRAVDARGRLLWVYRDLGACGAPVYYLHGLFG